MHSKVTKLLIHWKAFRWTGMIPTSRETDCHAQVETMTEKLMTLAEGMQFGQLLTAWRSVSARLEKSTSREQSNTVTTLHYLKVWYNHKTYQQTLPNTCDTVSTQVSLLRLCIVRVAQSGGSEAVRALYSKYREALQPPEEWQDWMVLQVTPKIVLPVA